MLYGTVSNRLRDDETAAPRPVDPASWGDVWASAVDAQIKAYNLNSEWALKEEEFDTASDGVFAVTGVRLPNPLRLSGLAMDMTPDAIERRTGRNPVSDFEARIVELSEQNPERAREIRAFGGVLERAYAKRNASVRALENVTERASHTFNVPLLGPVNPIAVAGGMWGSLYDPATLAVNTVGSLGTGGSLLYHFMRSAVINAGAEAVQQPFIKQWADEAGDPYSWTDAARGVLAAGMLGGVLDTGVRGSYRGLQMARGLEPMRESGRITGWRAPADRAAALDEAALRLPEDSPVRRAAEGDVAAVREVAEATGAIEDPALRGAILERELMDGLEGPPPMAVDGGDGLSRLGQALRAAVDPDEPPPSVLASFAGESAIERLARRGYTLGRDALTLAKEMDARGASREAIWETTSRLFKDRMDEDGPMFYGVFKGADGKWRVEFDESELIAVPGRGVGVGAGSDIAELYPASRSISYDFDEAAGRLEGSHQSIFGHSRIKLDARSADELRSAVAHELQHFVQKQEGFARGGSPDEFRARDLPSMDQIMAEIARLDEIAVRHMFRASDGTIFARPYHWIAARFYDRRIAGMERVATAIQDLATSDRKNAFDIYTRLAGEVEARNVQTRLNLSMDERYDVPPWATEGVAPDQQIVRFRSGRGEASISADAALEFLGNGEHSSPRASLPREGRVAAGAEALRHADRSTSQAALLGGTERMAAAMAREAESAHTAPRIADPSGPEAKLQTDALERDFATAIERATKAEQLRDMIRTLAGDAGDVAGTTKRLAIAEGRYTHTAAYDDLAPEIRADIARAMKMLPRDVRVRVEERLDIGGAPADGAWDGFDRIVFLALDAPDRAATLRHETIHALRQSGLMTDVEFDTLYRFAERIGLREAAEIDARYGDAYRTAFGNRGDAGVEALLREETIAEMFAAHQAGRRFGKDAFDRAGGRAVDKIFDAISKFLARVRELLTGRKIATVDDIFEAIESGAMARRADRVTLPGGMEIDGFHLFSIRAFHGTPHTFEPEPGAPAGRFRASQIGTGEGAQAYGHGLYFAESEGVARSYQQGLPFKKIRDDFRGALPDDAEFEDLVDLIGTGHFTPYQDRVLRALAADDWLGFDYPSQAISAAYSSRISEWDPSQELLDAIRATGRLYEVRINAEPEQFLDWDLPLRDQHPNVRKAVAPLARSAAEKMSVSDRIAANQAKALGLPFKAPDIDVDALAGHHIARGNEGTLRDAGIVGIRYLDGSSRNAGDGTRNVVVFPGNEHLVEIVAVDGQPVVNLAQALAEAKRETGLGKLVEACRL